MLKYRAGAEVPVAQGPSTPLILSPSTPLILSPSTPLILSPSKDERRSGQACRRVHPEPVEGYILSLSKDELAQDMLEPCLAGLLVKACATGVKYSRHPFRISLSLKWKPDRTVGSPTRLSDLP